MPQRTFPYSVDRHPPPSAPCSTECRLYRTPPGGSPPLFPTTRPEYTILPFLWFSPPPERSFQRPTEPTSRLSRTPVRPPTGH